MKRFEPFEPFERLERVERFVKSAFIEYIRIELESFWIILRKSLLRNSCDFQFRYVQILMRTLRRTYSIETIWYLALCGVLMQRMYGSRFRVRGNSWGRCLRWALVRGRQPKGPSRRYSNGLDEPPLYQVLMFFCSRTTRN